MPDFSHGSRAGILLDDRDITRLITNWDFSDAIDTDEQTTLQAPGGAKEFLYGNNGAAASFDGRLLKSLPDVQREMAAVIGQEDDPKLLTGAPFGFDPGRLAIMFRTRQQSFRVPEPIGSVVNTSAAFAADGPSLPGVMLHSPRFNGNASLNQKYALVAAGASVSGVFTVRDPNGNSLGTITILLTDGPSQVATKIAALSYHSQDLAATVTGSVSVPNQNVANGATVTRKSSEGNDHDVVSINDGDNSTFFASDSDEPVPATPQWVKFDLGSAKLFDRVTIRARDSSGSAAPKDFVLQGSATGAFTGEQTAIVTRTGETFTAGQLKTFNFAAATFRYVRLYITLAGTADSNVEIAEFALLSPATSSGSFAVEVTTPAATHLSFETVTAGWTPEETQPGGIFQGVNLVGASTNGTPVKSATAATTEGGTAHLHAPMLVGSTISIPVIIEHAPDSTGSPGTWAQLLAFTTITDPDDLEQTAQRVVLDPGTTVHPWLRARIPGGATGTVALGVAFSRRAAT